MSETLTVSPAASLPLSRPAPLGAGERIHALVKKAAPNLTPKTWYGMPAYADKDGKVVVFFRDAAKFKERYAMLGFNDAANLDDGTVWPGAAQFRYDICVEKEHPAIKQAAAAFADAFRLAPGC